MKTFLITTIGCKVNQTESLQFARALCALGLTPVPPGQAPDLHLVHTCAVTVEAMGKSRRAVRAAAATAACAVVSGCWASAGRRSAGHETENFPGAQLVIANGPDAEAIDMLTRWVRRQRNTTRGNGSDCGQDSTTSAAGLGLGEDDRWMSPTLPDNESVGHGQRPATASLFNIVPDSRTVKHNFDAQLLKRQDTGNDPADDGWAQNHTRAFVKIQDGCDACCSFCIVPALRPRLHSPTVGQVVDEVRSFVAAGYREVVLCGIFLGAFGRSTCIRRRWAAPPEPRMEVRGRAPGRGDPLLQLLDAVSRVEGLARLRLSSLEPGDVTDELLGLMADRPNLVPHLHLPLQSGSDAVLGRMNRQYRRADYERMIARVQARLDRPALATDILVGFPGETESDFQATLAVARLAGFAKIHVFRFSPRPGTPAARWTDRFVAPQIVRDRADRLAELASQLSLAYRRRFLGQPARVIIERLPSPPSLLSPDPRTAALRRGRTDRYFMVHFAADAARPGDPPASDPSPLARSVQPQSPDPLARRLATVRIDDVSPGGTAGTLISIDD